MVPPLFIGLSDGLFRRRLYYTTRPLFIMTYSEKRRGDCGSTSPRFPQCTCFSILTSMGGLTHQGGLHRLEPLFFRQYSLESTGLCCQQWQLNSTTFSLTKLNIMFRSFLFVEVYMQLCIFKIMWQFMVNKPTQLQ